MQQKHLNKIQEVASAVKDADTYVNAETIVSNTSQQQQINKSTIKKSKNLFS